MGDPVVGPPGAFGLPAFEDGSPCGQVVEGKLKADALENGGRWITLTALVVQEYELQGFGARDYVKTVDSP